MLQVQVFINNVPSHCNGLLDDNPETSCDFQWSGAATPQVTEVTPTFGGAGTSVAITGDHFLERNKVQTIQNLFFQTDLHSLQVPVLMQVPPSLLVASRAPSVVLLTHLWPALWEIPLVANNHLHSFLHRVRKRFLAIKTDAVWNCGRFHAQSNQRAYSYFLNYEINVSVSSQYFVALFYCKNCQEKFTDLCKLPTFLEFLLEVKMFTIAICYDKQKIFRSLSLFHSGMYASGKRTRSIYCQLTSDVNAYMRRQ